MYDDIIILSKFNYVNTNIVAQQDLNVNLVKLNFMKIFEAICEIQIIYTLVY